MIRRPPRSTLFPTDALPISERLAEEPALVTEDGRFDEKRPVESGGDDREGHAQSLAERSEEHTSELQSQFHLVCRLLLEKKKRMNLSTERNCIQHSRVTPCT